MSMHRIRTIETRNLYEVQARKQFIRETIKCLVYGALCFLPLVVLHLVW